MCMPNSPVFSWASVAGWIPYGYVWMHHSFLIAERAPFRCKLAKRWCVLSLKGISGSGTIVLPLPCSVMFFISSDRRDVMGRSVHPTQNVVLLVSCCASWCPAWLTYFWVTVLFCFSRSVRREQGIHNPQNWNSASPISLGGAGDRRGSQISPILWPNITSSLGAQLAEWISEPWQFSSPFRLD